MDTDADTDKDKEKAREREGACEERKGGEKVGREGGILREREREKERERERERDLFRNSILLLARYVHTKSANKDDSALRP